MASSKAAINQRKGILARISVLRNKEEVDENDMKEIIKIMDKLTEINETIIERMSYEELEDDQIDEEVVKQEEYLARVSEVNSMIQKVCIKSQDTKKIVKSVPVKLPKISLPKFSGDPMEWISFWDRFESSVHQQSSLSEVDKLIYLKACLSGKALSSIEGFNLTNGNYPIVRQLLIQKFGNQDLIKKHMMDKLLDLPTITSNAGSLQAFIDHIEMHMRMLENLNVSPNEFKAALSNMVLNQLPKTIRLELLKDCGEDWLDLDVILVHLKKLCRRLQLNSFSGSSSGSSQESKGHARVLSSTHAASSELDGLVNAEPSHSVKSKSSNSSYSNSANSSAQSSVPKCIFCSESHWSSDCSNHNLASRLNLIQSQNRCFKCLRTGHMSRDCKSKVHCYTCKGSHHTAVCKNEKMVKKTKSATNATLQELSSANESVSESSDTVVISQAKCSGTDSVMLQVASVYVEDPSNPDKKIKANILLDTGSQKSFVSQSLAKKINAQSKSVHNLNLSVFGNDDSSTHEANLVQPTLQSMNSDSTFQLEALTIPHLTKPIFTIPVSILQNIKSFRKLPFAFDVHDKNELPIDILIGADYYYSFVLGEIRKAGSLTATRTVFGWTVSGKLSEAQSNHVSVNLSLSGINEDLSKFWNLENMGVSANEELHAYHDLKLINGRYEVKLPVKSNISKLNPNFEIAQARVNKLEKSLDKDEVLKKEFLQQLKKKEVNVSAVEKSKVLGVPWDLKRDLISVEIKSIDNSREPTMRNILSILASIYDLLGMLSPVVLNGKMILKKFHQRKFNLKRAPWGGGFFERLVRSVKLSLKKVIGRSKLSYKEMEVYVVECEAAINSRPLSYVSGDADEFVLTPAHFLIGRMITSVPTVSDFRSGTQSSCVNLRVWNKVMKKTQNNFWNTWRKQYLQELMDRHPKQRKRDAGGGHVTVGDIVLVQDDRFPRLYWKIGRVQSLLLGLDGKCRAVEVQTLSPGNRRITLKRSPKMLYPIEVQENE